MPPRKKNKNTPKTMKEKKTDNRGNQEPLPIVSETMFLFVFFVFLFVWGLIGAANNIQPIYLTTSRDQSEIARKQKK